MALRFVRAASALAATGLMCALASPACVVRLSERNAPDENGDVTGPATDCATVQPLVTSLPGAGEAAPLLVGRYDMTDPKRPTFDWSGNYMRGRFEGTKVSVGISLAQKSVIVFEAVIDSRAPIKFTVSQDQETYLLADDLPPGEHDVMVMRNSEALFGIASFTGFDYGTDGKALPPTQRPRRIEYIGDSITCGYGNEGPNATCPYDVEVEPGVRVPLTENIYEAYGSRAARELSADAVTTCYSGKGVVLNYREPADDPDAKTTIPQYWERTIATKTDGPKWDFSKEVEPQVVVVSLGTNDYTRDIDQDTIADGIDVEPFKAGYIQFLKRVRQVRPNAHIFVAISPMLSDQFPFIDARKSMRDVYGQIVDQLNAEGDTKVYRFELVEMGSRYGLGCDYHPNLEVHRIMTEQLVGAIRSKTCW